MSATGGRPGRVRGRRPPRASQVGGEQAGPAAARPATRVGVGRVAGGPVVEAGLGRRARSRACRSSTPVSRDRSECRGRAGRACARGPCSVAVPARSRCRTSAITPDKPRTRAAQCQAGRLQRGVEQQPGLAVGQVEAGEVLDAGEPVVQRLPVDLQRGGGPRRAPGAVEEDLGGLGEHRVGQQRAATAGSGPASSVTSPPGAELGPVRDGGEVRDRGGDPGGGARLRPLRGQLRRRPGAPRDTPAVLPGGRPAERRGGQRAGRPQVAGRGQRHEDGDGAAVRQRRGDRAGRRAAAIRPGGRAGAGRQRHQHLGGVLAEDARRACGPPAPAAAGAAGQRRARAAGRGPRRRASRSASSRPASAARSTAAASAGSPASAGSMRPPSSSHR